MLLVPEFVGTIASAMADSVAVAEPLVDSAHAGRSVRVSGSSALIGADLVDMDSGTPGLQFIDATGDSGGDWYYKVAAVNGPCAGPR